MSTATATTNPFEVEATNSGGSGEMPSEGNHPAVLAGLVDLGTHADEYQGKEYENRKVLFAWEIPGELQSSGEPFVLTAEFNMPPKLSGKSKLRSMLEGWRGKPMSDGERLDLVRLVGVACLLNVGHAKTKKGSDYAKILGITPMVKGMAPPRPFLAPFVHAVGSGEFDPPSWLPYLYGRPVGDVIAECKEVKGYVTPAAPAVDANGTPDNDIPF